MILYIKLTDSTSLWILSHLREKRLFMSLVISNWFWVIHLLYIFDVNFNKILNTLRVIFWQRTMSIWLSGMFSSFMDHRAELGHYSWLKYVLYQDQIHYSPSLGGVCSGFLKRLRMVCIWYCCYWGMWQLIDVCDGDTFNRDTGPFSLRAAVGARWKLKRNIWFGEEWEAMWNCETCAARQQPLSFRLSVVSCCDSWSRMTYGKCVPATCSSRISHFPAERHWSMLTTVCIRHVIKHMHIDIMMLF